MELLLRRKPAADGAILGELLINGRFECFTLERLGVEIAPGTYPITLRMSAHFGRILPHIEPVPGRSELMIHILNWAKQSDGCIGVGQEHTVSSVAHSELALNALQSQIAGALARHEPVSITIEPAGTVSTVVA